MFGGLSPFVGATIKQPSFYMGGSFDLIAGNSPEAIAAMKQALPDLRHVELLAGVGHWIQQERPEQVNAAMLDFFAGL